ncbi:MAG: hypothetical protein ACK56I_15360, partial [bacterium]
IIGQDDHDIGSGSRQRLPRQQQQPEKNRERTNREEPTNTGETHSLVSPGGEDKASQAGQDTTEL